ncbi:PucR family transcriptional regulator [Nocardia asteroides]|uniref:PucR family transcriptional regulator n=1 Tax=Nocardia asteroides TaxID=1824 RepID=UPI001E3E7A71|nr:PucR family transcriptional regulator [Nocardia asteroides]UGT57393.1 PucR family transcriptional regulator ligand-binding domain-containing protein [Nocardia asteroides]
MLSISRLVADPALGLRVVTPELEERLGAEIRWLHTTELPDPSPYVRSGELVLTNGLWYPHVAAERFIDAVARAGAAGLVFGLTAQTPTLPAELVTLCMARGLPLVELCIGVPFAALTRAAARIQNEVLQAELTATVRRGDALATALSRGSGAAGVLEILRGDTELPLLVVDRRGRCLAAIGCEPEGEQIRLAAAALNRTPPPLEVDLLGAGPSALYLVEGAMGEIDAGLYCLEPASALTAADREALDQAARFLSLEVTKQQAVQAIEARFATELLEMILSGPARSDEVSQRLRAYGVPPDGPLAVFALAPGDPTPLDDVADAAGALFATHGIPVFTAAGSRDVVAVCPWERGAAELSRFTESLPADVARRAGAGRIVIGLGDIASTATELRDPLVRAREVCQVLRSQNGPDTATFADIATHRMLLGLLDADVLARFTDQVLGAVRAHDARAGAELEHTLRVFLANDGQWGVTAAALHVHVNTLRNRMGRIAELTGRDVNRLDDLVDLFLAASTRERSTLG